MGALMTKVRDSSFNIVVFSCYIHNFFKLWVPRPSWGLTPRGLLQLHNGTKKLNTNNKQEVYGTCPT